MKGAFATLIVHSLLFIAASIAAYLFISSLYKSLYEMQGAMIEKEKITAEKLKTVIDIDSCYYNSSTGVLSLYVTNRGFTALNASKINVFINGIYKEANVTFVKDLNSNNIWERYEIIRVDINSNTGTFDVKVITENGAYDEKTVIVTSNSCSIA